MMKKYVFEESDLYDETAICIDIQYLGGPTALQSRNRHNKTEQVKTCSVHKTVSR